MTLAPDDPRHGTANAFRWHRCRCEPCRAASAKQDRDYRAFKKASGPPPPGDPRHGKRSTYSEWRCRCELCCEAENAYHAAWKLRTGRTITLRPRQPVGPERERDERRWNGRIAPEYGCTVTFENEDGATLTLHRKGAPEAALAALCDEAKAIDATLRVVSYSSPPTILSDVTGPPTRNGRRREASVLGQIGRLEMLHRRLRGLSRHCETKYRALDTLAR